MQRRIAWLFALLLYIGLQAAPVAMVWQASSEAMRWQGMEQIVERTFLALLFCVAWSLVAPKQPTLMEWLNHHRVWWSGWGILPFGGMLAVIALSFLPHSATKAVAMWFLFWVSVAGLLLRAVTTDLLGRRERLTRGEGE